LALAKDINPGD